MRGLGFKMAKCELCKQSIKTGDDEWMAKSAFNYHKKCYVDWANGEGALQFDEDSDEYVEDSNY